MINTGCAIMRLAVSLACKGETAERIICEASNIDWRFHLLARVKPLSGLYGQEDIECFFKTIMI